MQTNRQRQSQQTRARIQQAANVCFARKGMAYTLIADIIAEAGISVGTFYHYFKNKEDLIISQFFPFDIGFSSYADQLLDEGDTLEKLLRFSFIFSRDSQRSENREANLEYLKARVSITMPELWPCNRPYYLLLFTIIAEGQATCQLRRDVPPARMADMVMIVTRGYNFDWANTNGNYVLYDRIGEDLPVLFSSLRYENAPNGPHNGCGLRLPAQLVPDAYQSAVQELANSCQARLDALTDQAVPAL